MTSKIGRQSKIGKQSTISGQPEIDRQPEIGRSFEINTLDQNVIKLTIEGAILVYESSVQSP